MPEQYSKLKLMVLNLLEDNQIIYQGYKFHSYYFDFVKNKESLLEEIKELYLGGASGSIIGRNSFQRPYTEAIALLNQIIDIYKGKRFES